MASYLKPRRGTASNSSSIVLKSGEIFFEIGNSGTPTTGSGAKSFGKIKMGDGSTSYSNLGYFIDVDTTAVDWTDSTSTATSAAQGADNYQDLNAITPTATLKSILGNIKSLLFNHSTQITTINSKLSDRVIATSNGDNTTPISTRLGVIKTAWNALTDDQKGRCVILFGGTIFHCMNASYGMFANTYYNGTYMIHVQFNLDITKYYSGAITSVTDTSSNTSSNNLILVLRGNY